MYKFLLVAFLHACATCTAWADDLPGLGSKLSERVALGRSIFSLPKGEWTVVGAESPAAVYFNNGSPSPGAAMARVVLVQEASNSNVRAMIELFAPLSSNAGSWRGLKLCDVSATYHSDDFGSDPTRDNFECLRIAALVNPYFEAGEARTGLAAAIYEQVAAGKIKFPRVLFRVRYGKVHGGDYAFYHVYLDSAQFGVAPAALNNAASWNQPGIAAFPDRVEFANKVKQLGYQLAITTRSTLSSRRPDPSADINLEQLEVRR